MNKLKKFPKTDTFQIIDTLPVPHPFMIGPKHVVHATDHFSGILSNEAIVDYEKQKGHSCCTKGCNLSFEEHKQVLLVEVDSEEELENIPELQEYLKSCVEQMDEGEYEGFSFIKRGT